LIEITCNGSNGLIVCVVGVWQHILENYCSSAIVLSPT